MTNQEKFDQLAKNIMEMVGVTFSNYAIDNQWPYLLEYDDTFETFLLRRFNRLGQVVYKGIPENIDMFITMLKEIYDKEILNTLLNGISDVKDVPFSPEQLFEEWENWKR